MSDVDWGNYAEAYKTIHDKLNQILAKLDQPSDPAVQDIIDRGARLVGIIYGDVGQLLQRPATRDLLIQLRHAGTEIDPRQITDLPKKGTSTRVNATASGEIVAAPSANNHLELRGFMISVDADEIVRLRWGGATGPIITMLPTKGILAMNLINIDEKGGGGATPQNLYLEKTGTGNCQGTVWTETVAD